MINDKKHAQDISELMLEIGKKLNQSLLDIQNNISEDEFNQYRDGVAKVMGYMYFDIMQPLYQKHPELKPAELD